MILSEFSIAEWIIITIGLITIIPLIFTLDSFRYTKIKDYFIFSLIFLFTIINSLNVPYLDPWTYQNYLISNYTFVFIYFFVMYLAFIVYERSIGDRKLTRAISYPIYAITLMFLIAILSIPKDIILYKELFRTLAGLILTISFAKVPILHNVGSANRVKRYWIIIGSIILLNGLSNVLVEISGMSATFDFFYFITNLISVLSILFIFFYVATKHPEMFLLTQGQLQQIEKLYADAQNLSNSGGKSFSITQKQIINYLKSLPPDLL